MKKKDERNVPYEELQIPVTRIGNHLLAGSLQPIDPNSNIPTKFSWPKPGRRNCNTYPSTHALAFALADFHSNLPADRDESAAYPDRQPASCHIPCSDCHA